MCFWFCLQKVSHLSDVNSQSYMMFLARHVSDTKKIDFQRGWEIVIPLSSIVFIDYSKAFDSVSHIQMVNILNDMGFPRHIVALIQALYEKQSAIVRWNGSHTKPFFIEKDVQQGSIIHCISTALMCL